MPNGDSGNGYGGYGPGMIGRIPSQQIRVEEKSETPLLLKQYKWAVAISVGFVFALYAAINILFGKEDLHNIVIGIYTAFSVGAFIWLRRFFERIYENYYLFSEISEAGVVRDHLSMNTVRAFVLSTALFIGLATQTTDYVVSVLHFPEGTPHLGVILISVGRFSVLAFVVAMIYPTMTMIYRLVKAELGDPYHSDTQTKQNSDKLALEREKLRWEQQKYFIEHEPASEQVIDQPKQLPGTVYLNVSRNNRPELNPETESYMRACVEFLNGLEEGLWGTSEATWRGEKYLKVSGYKVRAIAPRIRDDLIKADWAAWKNPSDHTAGWRLTADVDTILKDGFNVGTNKQPIGRLMPGDGTPTVVSDDGDEDE